MKLSLITAAVLVAACDPRARAAEAGYATQQMACFKEEDAGTRDACIANVRAAWSKDAGKDGAP